MARKVNPMLAKIQARHELDLRFQREFTIQQCCDMMLIAANDAFGFGADRLAKLQETYYAFRWDDGLDVDNHAAIGKMVVDAMKGWVIQDDSPRWVKRVVHEFWDGGCVGEEVRGMG